MDKELHFKFNAPLNDQDTETQTFGCRQNNPDICGYNGMPGICAFASADKCCKHPSKAWKKKFLELSLRAASCDD